MSLPQIAEALLRQKLTVVGVALTAFIAAAWVTFSLPTEYEATATLVVGASGPVSQNSAPVERDQTLARTYAELLRTPSAEALAARALGDPNTGAAIASKVGFEAVGGTSLLRITAGDPDPGRAAAIANAYAQSFVRDREEALSASARETLTRANRRLRELALRVDRLARSKNSAAVGALEQARTELTAERDAYLARRQSLATQGSTVSVASGARVPDSPARPAPKLYLTVGALLAGLLAVFAGVLRDSFDTRVRNEDELVAILGAPILGRLPRARRTLEHGASLDERFQLLRSSVESHDPDHRLLAIGVTSATRGAGATFVVAGLARAFAMIGARVAAVDCNLRHPALHSRFNVERGQGLSEALADLRSPETLLEPTDIPTLQVLSAGPTPPNAAVLLTRDSFLHVLTPLRAAVDYVICDIPPAATGADAASALASVDCVIVVVDARSAHSSALRAIRDGLDNAGTRVLGVVVNRMRNTGFTGVRGFDDIPRPAAGVRAKPTRDRGRLGTRA